MKPFTKLLSLMMILALAVASVPAVWAESTQIVTTVDKETVIPITITAETTRLSVTLPTAFPMVINPETGECQTPDDVKIVNGSSGAVRVSELRVERAGDWSLASFEADLRNANVDSNQIGVSVQPTGGRAGGSGTALTTSGVNIASEILLNGENAEWIIDATDGEDGGSDELGLVYSAATTPVSARVYNAQVASIIITITWNR